MKGARSRRVARISSWGAVAGVWERCFQLSEANEGLGWCPQPPKARESGGRAPSGRI